MSFKAGARKAGCNVLTACGLNRARCEEAFEWADKFIMRHGQTHHRGSKRRQSRFYK